jgi:molybdopterin-binding protein
VNSLRIGEAAALLGVSVATVRRWLDSGRLRSARTAGGQRLVDGRDVARYLAEHREEAPLAAPQSARNRFAGVVTRVVRDRVMAQVEIQSGPHRVVSLMSREAADELNLQPGRRAVAVVKATNVGVESAPE